MLQGKKILIVDDNDLNIFALSASLKPRGPKLFTAKDGAECINVLRNNSEIELVLLDMMMPVMDGYEALTIIRQDEQLKNVPVIALTAQAMLGDAEKCINAGANDYCSKPVDIDLLLKKICALIKL